MTEEAPVIPPAVVAPGIERIIYSIREYTSLGVIQKINECVAHNKQIKLEMKFNDRFDATLAMQNTIVENSRYIKKIKMHNFCNEKDEHGRCFNFFIRIVQGIIGNRKHLMYHSYRHEFDLEQANQLADALRSNNNNNGAIESFRFHESNLTPVTFQPLWNVLLARGVRKIKFGMDDSTDNISIDFTGIETNKSLKKLDLFGLYMRKEDFRNLFHSIKKNKGLEELTLSYRGSHLYLPIRMERLFEEMLFENITLLDCCLYTRGREEDKIYEMVQFHMNLNLMWKRYVMKRNEESTVAAIHAHVHAPVRAPVRAEAVIVASTEEANNKKIFKMRFLLHLFMKKPVLRNTIIFHLLREYPDDLVGNNNDNNNELLRINSSNLARNKRKRTNDDGENKSNDGTDDS